MRERERSPSSLYWSEGAPPPRARQQRPKQAKPVGDEKIKQQFPGEGDPRHRGSSLKSCSSWRAVSNCWRRAKEGDRACGASDRRGCCWRWCGKPGVGVAATFQQENVERDPLEWGGGEKGHVRRLPFGRGTRERVHPKVSLPSSPTFSRGAPALSSREAIHFPSPPSAHTHSRVPLEKSWLMFFPLQRVKRTEQRRSPWINGDRANIRVYFYLFCQQTECAMRPCEVQNDHAPRVLVCPRRSSSPGHPCRVGSQPVREALRGACCCAPGVSLVYPEKCAGCVDVCAQKNENLYLNTQAVPRTFPSNNVCVCVCFFAERIDDFERQLVSGRGCG